MHEWLNVGHQKEQINGSATDALCPCCGLEHEDQSHMFRCHSTTARIAIKEGLKAMKKGSSRDNIPSRVQRSFINKVKQATTDPSPRVTVQCLQAWAAGEAQDRLGTMAVLRGRHHK